MKIKEGFKSVRSDFTNAYCYAMNGEMAQRDKVRSIIPHMKSFRPSQMEIWYFKDIEKKP
jgi:hypothetical protein